MQTSINYDGLTNWRVKGFRRYSASDESLGALKARTTPPDSTNPFITPHASCAQAFLAMAVSQQDRLGELHLQLEDALDTSSAVTLPPLAPVSTTLAGISPLPLLLMPQAPLPNINESERDSVMPSMVLSDAPTEIALAFPVQLFANHDAIPQLHTENRALPLTEAVKAEAKIEVEEIQLLEFQDDSGTAQFSGTAPNGTLVQFYIDDVLVGSTEADDKGHWQFSAPSQLPAAEHSFSAVLTEQNGAIKSKIDFAFIHHPQPEMIILPVNDSAFEDIDNALIELMMASEEAIPALLPLLLTEDMLDAEQILGGVSLQPMNFITLHEMESDAIIWH